MTNYNCEGKIKQLTDKSKELSDISGLPTKVGRLRVDGYRSVNGNIRTYFENNLVGLTSGDCTINGISEHLLEIKTSRNVNFFDVRDIFTNPLKIDKIKIDENGRKSIKYIGEFATISINSDTVIIITVWKTSSKRVKKLKGDKK